MGARCARSAAQNHADPWMDEEEVGWIQQQLDFLGSTESLQNHSSDLEHGEWVELAPAEALAELDGLALPQVVQRSARELGAILHGEPLGASVAGFVGSSLDSSLEKAAADVGVCVAHGARTELCGVRSFVRTVVAGAVG